MLPHLEKGKTLKPQDVMKFPWDQETKTVAIAPKDANKNKEFWDKVTIAHYKKSIVRE